MDAMNVIVEAQNKGIPDNKLDEARKLHRKSAIRWDFISSENSTGFHSPQESARILANSINFARQSQLAAVKARK